MRWIPDLQVNVSRRQAIRAAGLAAGAGVIAASPLNALASQSKKLKILILGGTGFLGPKIVQNAIDRGHEVTLFNRGMTNPHLFPDLEKLVGDRYGDMSALEGREWDAVIDPFTYVPRTVKASAELLAPNVGYYLVISSISVYAAFPERGLDETAPLATVPDEAIERITSHRQVGQHYGGLKALCEQAAEEVMPGRTCSVRPGLIVGDGDMTNRFTWWPYRVRRGGRMIAPGDPDKSVQVINVYDLGEFIVTATEKGLKGAYNADSKPGSITMGSILETSNKVSGTNTEVTWMDPGFLEEQGVHAWAHLPGWLPPEGDYTGAGYLSVEKATRAGLKQAPLATTIQQTYDWIDNGLPEPLKQQLESGYDEQTGRSGGLSSEREQRVLEVWRTRDPG